MGFEGRRYPMSKPAYRALRVVLGLFLHPPEAEISTLLLATMKEMGGLALMLGIMFFLASRDPKRNVAIIHALAIGLCILAVTPLISLYTLDVVKLYPASAVWGRSLARLALAALVYFLSPRERVWNPAEHL